MDLDNRLILFSLQCQNYTTGLPKIQYLLLKLFVKLLDKSNYGK